MIDFFGEERKCGLPLINCYQNVVLLPDADNLLGFVLVFSLFIKKQF